MTLRRAMFLGGVLGVGFSAAAAVADFFYRRHLPHHEVFADPSGFLASLHK